MRQWIRGLVGAMMLGALVPATADGQGLPVDLELVLAVDVSGSMDPEEQRLQRAGYVAALVHPEVLAAIRTGAYGRIAVTYVEWAGAAIQNVTIPWRVIEDPASAEDFVAELDDLPFARHRGTSISGALQFAGGLFQDNGFESWRQVIDVSGDGPNNMGVPVVPVRDALVEQGIVINGLPITIDRSARGFASISNLDVYYQDCVIGGPGAFMIPIDTHDQFVEATRRKLVLEIAGRPPLLLPASQHAETPRIDCMIGERLRRSWMEQ
ncbi:MAG TPA: DUF1194 domain-containing protein [Geminicoccaceae bacterium]|nr:DUF1194 domain-containing protein [Geminicoccaceae bacterium]